jgi:hypothetical protein
VVTPTTGVGVGMRNPSMSKWITWRPALPVVLALLCSLAIWGWLTGRLEERDLYGIWSGEHDNRELLFRFEPDHTCSLRFRDKGTGTETVLDGTFETDFTKQPVPVSIRNIAQLSHPLHTIVTLRADGTLWVAPFSPRSRLRPIAFDPKVTMELRRVEDP